jgi:hypothetical protein
MEVQEIKRKILGKSGKSLPLFSFYKKRTKLHSLFVGRPLRIVAFYFPHPFISSDGRYGREFMGGRGQIFGPEQIV